MTQPVVRLKISLAAALVMGVGQFCRYDSRYGVFVRLCDQSCTDEFRVFSWSCVADKRDEILY